VSRRRTLASVRSRLAPVRLLAFDVDGVLTDGGILVHPDGGESKWFHVRDGLGIVAALRAGLSVAFVSGRRSAAVAARARELGVAADLQGVKDKAAALRELRGSLGVSREETAFLGDDVVDLPAFAESGVAVAVADAHPRVLDAADAVCSLPGGRGAARELVEAVLLARGLGEALPGLLPPPRGKRPRRA
jgi:3-deoxy-D-manno-octulosonate 8-phosphate phosphatase (KDO 8-P phosphatase)